MSTNKSETNKQTKHKQLIRELIAPGIIMRRVETVAMRRAKRINCIKKYQKIQAD